VISHVEEQKVQGLMGRVAAEVLCREACLLSDSFLLIPSLSVYEKHMKLQS